MYRVLLRERERERYYPKRTLFDLIEYQSGGAAEYCHSFGLQWLVNPRISRMAIADRRLLDAISLYKSTRPSSSIM